MFATAFGYINSMLTIPEVLYMQSFISMQLLEYFIWSKTFDNRVLSIVGLLLVLSQPVFAILAIKQNHVKYIPWLLVGYAFVLTVVLLYVKPWGSINFTTSPGPNGHLAWYWLDFPIAFLLVWLLFLVIRYVLQQQWGSLLFTLVSFFVSLILYHKTKTWGSMWCWFANSIAILILIQVFSKDVCTLKKS